MISSLSPIETAVFCTAPPSVQVFAVPRVKLLTKRVKEPFLCAFITDPVVPLMYPKTCVIVKEYGANHTMTLIGAVGLRTVPPFVMICGGGPSQKFVPSNDTVT